jgi:Flp pilus assembly protein TadD
LNDPQIPGKDIHVQRIIECFLIAAPCVVAQTVPAEQLLHRIPRSAAREYRASTSALGKGDLTQAIAHCRKALELDPANASAHDDLGILYMWGEETEKAREQFAQAIALEPRLVTSHINESLALLTLGRPGEAEASAREALRIAPAEAFAHLLLGWSLAAQNRYTDDSLLDLRFAARQYPEAHLAMADVLIHRGLLAEAKREVEAYLASDAIERRPMAEAWLKFLTIQ